MKNEAVAEAFVEGKEAKTKHMFIDGRNLYSYGYHFPIAVRLEGNIFILNEDGYSVTTARHKCLIKRTIGNGTIIYLNTEKLKSVIEKGITTYKELILNKLIEEEK